MLPLTTFYRSGAQKSNVNKRDVFVTSWRFHNRAWQPQRYDRLPETSGTLWIHRAALGNQRCSLATGCGISHQMVMVMVMNDLLPPPFVQCQSALPFWKTAFSNLTMKIHGQGHVRGQSQGHVWPSKFKGQGYRQGQTHWSHLRPWSSIDMFAFCFVTIGLFLADYIANSIFDLENARSRSWLRSNPMITFEP